MKWKEIQQMLNRDPYIGDVIWSHLGEPMWYVRNPRESVGRQQITYLERYVDVITFRPFSSLDLDQSMSEITRKCLVEDLRQKCTEKVTEFVRVSFDVYSHLVPGDHRYNRVISAYPHDGLGGLGTIRDAIQAMVEKEEWGDPQHTSKRKKFDLVVKQTRKWSAVAKGKGATYKNPRKLDFDSCRVELYQFPRNFTP